MNFSAADLVKKSAAQILYLKFNPEYKEPTQRQLDGVAYQEKINKELKAYNEMRGVYELGNLKIYFSWDSLILKKKAHFYEIKLVKNLDNDWFLPQSLTQATFYASLSERVNEYQTPNFVKGIKHKVKVKEKKYHLLFGKDHYKIKPNKKVLNHYIQKANLIKIAYEYNDWDYVREWDLKYKHKDIHNFNLC